MSKKYITANVDDVLESAKKYGEDAVLTWDPKCYRDLKQLNKNAKYDCTYVDIMIRLANGESGILDLKFTDVITSSAAKLPQAEGDDVKNLNITFKTVTEEEIAVGDLVPKTLDSKEAQDKEDKKKADKVTLLVENTNKFVKALDIIDKSYKKISNDLKTAKSLPFILKKDKKVKNNNDINVYSIKQSHRDDRDKPGEVVELESPLYRIKLMVKDKTGEVGIRKYDSTTKTFLFTPNVYVVKKIKATKKTKAKTEQVLATVKVNGKTMLLDKENAPAYITYRSILYGKINFPCLKIHKFGISIDSSFNDIVVVRNKSNLREPIFSETEIAGIAADLSSDEEEVEINTVTDKFARTNLAANEDASDLEDGADSDLEEDEGDD
jgi:hypothetical protein